MASVWKGNLSFGLVNVPVKLNAAARPDRISFNQLHAQCSGKIKQQLFCPDCDAVVERTDLAKGYEVSKGEYVRIDEDALANCVPQSSRVMDVTTFVPLSQIDPLMLEASYYMAPEKGGERGYALMYAALNQSGMCGVASVTMHQREHLVLVVPGPRGLLMYTLFYQNELRVENEHRADTSLVVDAELNLACKLIEAMQGDFDHSQYEDSFRPEAEKVIQAAIAGGPPSQRSNVKEIRPSGDVMKTLEATLRALGKKTA